MPPKPRRQLLAVRLRAPSRASAAATLLDRVRLYNPTAQPNIQAKHLLRPIPQEQINATAGNAAFPQNPGY